MAAPALAPIHPLIVVLENGDWELDVPDWRFIVSFNRKPHFDAYTEMLKVGDRTRREKVSRSYTQVGRDGSGFIFWLKAK